MHARKRGETDPKKKHAKFSQSRAEQPLARGEPGHPEAEGGETRENDGERKRRKEGKEEEEREWSAASKETGDASSKRGFAHRFVDGSHERGREGEKDNKGK